MLRNIWLAAAALVLAVDTGAAVRFLAPLEGSQVFGRGYIEVATDVEAVDRVDIHVDGVLAGVARKPPYRVVWNFGDVIVAHRITATVHSSSYSQKESAAITTAALTAQDTIDVDLVEVPIRVRARQRELEPADFSLLENGVRQNILEIRERRGPTDFVFLVDRSLSMSGGKLEAALSAVGRSLGALRDDDTARIVLFNHQIGEPHKLTSAADLVKLAKETTPSGGTSLRDAIRSTSKLRRGIVIAISDGSDRNSASSSESILQLLGSNNVTLYAITLGGGNGSEFLETAARKTGGRILRSTRSSLSDDLGILLGEINSRYLLVYQSSGTAKGWRQIAVRSARRGVEVTSSRRGYFAQ